MILVADDNDQLRTALVEHLRRQGWQVLEAHDGAQALDLVKQHRLQLEALITDFEMPLLDGLSLIRKARHHCRDLRVLLITSRLPADLGSHSPPLEVLMKPFELSQPAQWLASPRTSGGSGSVQPIILTGQRSQSAHWTRRVGPWAAALPLALLVALLFGSFRSLQDWTESMQALPAPPIDERTRSVAVEGLGPVGVMASPPREFTWSPVTGAQHYRLGVTDLEGELIWKRESEEPRVELPINLRSDWISNVAFYIDIKAYAADGSVLASTTGQRVRVVPSATERQEPRASTEPQEPQGKQEPQP